MIIDSIATALDALYDSASFAEVGEDYVLIETEASREGSASVARYWREINEARKAAGVLTYDGLLTGAHHKAMAESEPNLKIDALLELAATALAFAASVDRQVNETAKPKQRAKAKIEEGE